MIKVIYRQQNTQFGFHVCIFLNTIKYIALEEVQSISSMHSEYWPDVTCDIWPETQINWILMFASFKCDKKLCQTSYFFNTVACTGFVPMDLKLKYCLYM